MPEMRGLRIQIRGIFVEDLRIIFARKADANLIQSIFITGHRSMRYGIPTNISYLCGRARRAERMKKDVLLDGVEYVTHNTIFGQHSPSDADFNFEIRTSRNIFVKQTYTVGPLSSSSCGFLV